MLDHKDALQAAEAKRLESNLARCYLELHQRLLELSPTYYCPLCNCRLDTQFKEIVPPFPVWPTLEKYR